MLLREYRDGVPTEDIAGRHQRTKIAIRSKLISVGVVDPEIPATAKSKHTGRFLIEESHLGLDEPRKQTCPRDSFAWTHAEWLLCIESFEDELDLILIADIHKRSVWSIIGINYSHPENNCLDGTAESEEELSMRYRREEEFGCRAIPGYRLVSDIVSDAVESEERQRFDDWLGESFDDTSSHDDDSDPAPPIGSDGWGEQADDYDAEYWESYLGGPDDSYYERREADNSDYESYPEDMSSTCSSEGEKVEREEVEYIEGECHAPGLFFVQSAYPSTMLAATAEERPGRGYYVSEVAGAEETLPSEFKQRTFVTIADLKAALDALKLRYPYA